jgi:hypothetical protein
MGLMVLDAPAADDLLEDLDQFCVCECGPGSHGPAGCQAIGCLCPAVWDGLGAEDRADKAEEGWVAARVTAVLVAVRARRRKIEDDREAAAAKDPARLPRSNRPRVKRKPAAEPKAPRAATTKPATARSKAPLPVEHSLFT